MLLSRQGRGRRWGRVAGSVSCPLERPLGAQASGFPDIPGRDPVRGDHPYGVTSIDDEAGVGSLVSMGLERVCGRGVDVRDAVGGGVVREGSGRAPSAGVAVGDG